MNSGNNNNERNDFAFQGSANPKANDSETEQKLEEKPESQQTNTEKTINYYKLLLYSLKIELKVHEFYNILRASSSSELGLWILSACILSSIPENLEITSKQFVWFHLVHVVRAIFGFILIFRLPKTYELIQNLEPEVLVSGQKTYNEVLREVGKREIMPQIENNRFFLIAFLILTFVNIIIDFIDLIGGLGSIDPNSTDKNYPLINFGYLVIAVLYLCIYNFNNISD